MSERLYANAQFRQMAAASQCGLVLASIQRIEFRTGLPELNRDAALAGATGVSILTAGLAQDASHPELRNAPILFWGFSAAAGFGTTFAALRPDRTIGFVRYHTHRRGAVTALDKLKAIPALLVAGGKDETAGVEDAEQLWKVARVNEAPWNLCGRTGSTTLLSGNPEKDRRRIDHSVDVRRLTPAVIARQHLALAVN